MTEEVAPGHVVVGKDLGLFPNNSDLSVVGVFSTKEEFDAYYASEGRQAVIKNMVNPAAAAVSSSSNSRVG